jgi:hypothetical protein
MLPSTVLRGQADSYWKLFPGSKMGCSPTTPGPLHHTQQDNRLWSVYVVISSAYVSHPWVPPKCYVLIQACAGGHAASVKQQLMRSL